MTTDEMLKQAYEMEQSELYKVMARIIIALRDKGHANVDDVEKSFEVIRYERFKRTDAWIDHQRYEHGLMPRLPIKKGAST